MNGSSSWRRPFGWRVVGAVLLGLATWRNAGEVRAESKLSSAPHDPLRASASLRFTVIVPERIALTSVQPGSSLGPGFKSGVNVRHTVVTSIDRRGPVAWHTVSTP